MLSLPYLTPARCSLTLYRLTEHKKHYRTLLGACHCRRGTSISIKDSGSAFSTTSEIALWAEEEVFLREPDRPASTPSKIRNPPQFSAAGLGIIDVTVRIIVYFGTHRPLQFPKFLNLFR